MTVKRDGVSMVHRTLLGMAVMVAVGCSHHLELTNLSQYEVNPVSNLDQAGLRVNVVFNQYGEQQQMLARSIYEALSRQGGYVVEFNSIRPEQSDVSINLTIGVEEDADASNFFVSWPGFIIFTHAWLGYGYSVSYRVGCEAIATVSGASIGTYDDTIRLTMRYADFGTTWAAGCGWLLFWSATAFVNGFYVLNYDADITPQLYSTAFHRIGSSVASDVIKMLNRVNWQGPDDVSY